MSLSILINIRSREKLEDSPNGKSIAGCGSRSTMLRATPIRA
jgi:hypothetical protein